MELRLTLRLTTMVVLLTTAGCCLNPPKDSGPPAVQRVIPLATAIKQVQDAVFEARQAAPDRKVGVVASKVTINFKIAAVDSTATTENLTLGVALGGVTVGGGTSTTSGKTDGAESSITLELSNPLLAASDTIIGTILARAGSNPGEKPLTIEQIQALIDAAMKGVMKMEIVPQ